MRVVAVYNIKGGVGKTATAVNLAYLSAESGARTLLWDLDPQGAATFYFRMEPRIQGGLRKLVRGRRPLDGYVRATDYEGLDLVPADFGYRNLDLVLDSTVQPKKRLERLLKPLASSYDHVYLDCAPSISLVSEGVFQAANTLLVPTMPTTLSLRTLQQLAEHLEREAPAALTVLPFFCIVDRRKALHRDVCEKSAGPFRYLETRIPYSSVVEQMGLHRAPVPVYAANSQATQAYRALWRETMGRTGSLWGWIEGLRQRWVGAGARDEG